MPGKNADKDTKYTYHEYYEMGLKMAKEDTEEETESNGTKQN